MKETLLIGTLLPSHPDFIPILHAIREKYKIPEIDPDENGIKEILLSDKDIDWHSVRQEIEAQVRNSPARVYFERRGRIPGCGDVQSGL